ncbi:MAG: hypothetical protein ABFC63_06330 [Thermoguttaceae bacterium]
MDHDKPNHKLDSHDTERQVMPATDCHHLNIRAAGKTYRLDFRQAFSFGYTLLRTRKFKDAARVFESMANIGGSDPAVVTMLAYCKAGLREYQACSALLCNVFVDDARPRAEQLHAAFVYLSVGMWTDAIDELTKMTRKCPDLPIVCLLLGDVLAMRGKRRKAILCWRLAAARDRKDGAVAAVARRLISSQTRTRPNP